MKILKLSLPESLHRFLDRIHVVSAYRKLDRLEQVFAGSRITPEMWIGHLPTEFGIRSTLAAAYRGAVEAGRQSAYWRSPPHSILTTVCAILRTGLRVGGSLPSAVDWCGLLYALHGPGPILLLCGHSYDVMTLSRHFKVITPFDNHKPLDYVDSTLRAVGLASSFDLGLLADNPKLKIIHFKVRSGAYREGAAAPVLTQMSLR